MPASSKRRFVDQTFSSASALIDNVVASILQNRRGAPHVIVGPVVWRPNEAGRRQWYFVLASGDPGFFSVMVGFGDDAELADQCRASALVAFLMRKPIVVHDMDDELAMARLCEAIWPCAKTRKVRAGIQAEREQLAMTPAQ